MSEGVRERAGRARAARAAGAPASSGLWRFLGEIQLRETWSRVLSVLTRRKGSSWAPSCSSSSHINTLFPRASAEAARKNADEGEGNAHLLAQQNVSEEEESSTKSVSSFVSLYIEQSHHVAKTNASEERSFFSSETTTLQLLLPILLSLSLFPSLVWEEWNGGEPTLPPPPPPL